MYVWFAGGRGVSMMFMDHRYLLLTSVQTCEVVHTLFINLSPDNIVLYNQILRVQFISCWFCCMK